jgi:hypothetical protein
MVEVRAVPGLKTRISTPATKTCRWGLRTWVDPHFWQETGKKGQAEARPPSISEANRAPLNGWREMIVLLAFLLELLAT